MLSFENKEVDEWFARFDKDSDGHLSLVEAKEMFRTLEAKMKSWRLEAARLGQKVEALKSKASGLEGAKRAYEEALDESVRADAQLSAHKCKKDVNVLVGAKLRSKVRSADNPKAVLTLEDVIAQWDIGRRRPGFIDCAEFTSLIGVTMGAGMSALGAEEVEGAFDALGASLQAAGGEGGNDGAKSIPIRQAVMGLLAATQERARADVVLLEASVQRRADARQAQRAIEQVVSDFHEEEEREAAEEEKKRLANTVKTAEDYKAIVQAKRRAEAEAAAAVAGGTAKAAGEDGVGDPLLAKLAMLDGTAEQDTVAVE